MNRSLLLTGFLLVVIPWSIFLNPVLSHANSTACPVLISPDALNQNLGHYIILDARPKKTWQKSHIPGALPLNWETYTRVDEQGIAFRMLPPEQMAEQLGKMGIDEASAIAIYGDADTSWGGEGWLAWIFSYLGHQGTVVILDGGIQAWKKSKFPLNQDENSQTNRPAKTYNALPNPDIDIKTEELSKLSKKIQIVDTRSWFEWIRGSIPGSVHINWENFFTGNTRKPIASNKLRDLLQKKGINPDKPVVYYCTGGVRSAYAWMVHCMDGLGPARNYEGGMEAWNKMAVGQ